MNLKTIIALAVAGAFAIPVAAQTSSGTDKPSGAAQGSASDKQKSEAGGTAPGGFAGIDKNSDGYISRDEAKDATWSNRFTELDKDNDGRLSKSEFDALGGAAAGASSVGDKPGQKQ